jgi:hypothetical protein
VIDRAIGSALAIRSEAAVTGAEIGRPHSRGRPFSGTFSPVSEGFRTGLACAPRSAASCDCMRCSPPSSLLTRRWRKADSNRWSHLRLNGSDTGERDEQIAISPLHRIDEQSLERLVIAHTFSAGPYSGAVQPGGGRLGREVRICNQRHSRGTHTRFAGLIATEKPEHVSVFKCSDFKPLYGRE